ncbi:dioxygenase-like protein [Kribbella orskensis]|uniref:Dioxygenase-like protein n=1 Tax=Kribbella orskensis TaxID=2512216 RepID=A0ABY2BHF4_9ACTN|nr:MULTISPECIES: intradiol ring-cleavage dioxygenase [Kribbella]TCN38067.1 dioxygenase-like protein [Kribbella sp. VKM Ac-2500]TCO19554.1 dioxygenase-like protein [Kribbella orskensis]
MTPPHEHDLGLVHDLGTLRRRNVLRLLAGVGFAAMAGCATDDSTSGGSTSPSSSSPSSSGTTSAGTPSATTSTGDVDEIPSETAGPFPGDGSNGPNVLTESGIVRSDITKSFGSSSGVAEGVPLTVELVVLDADKDTALAGAAVYLWHCDAQGRYSLYDTEITDENYLRGVQAADANGKVTFTTVFPAAYSGRWPHIHFEVYASLSEATAAGKISATSQLALPEEACKAVYATSGYDGSTQNLSRTSLQNDNVFGDDGGIHQLASMSGSVQEGYAARLTVGV